LIIDFDKNWHLKIIDDLCDVTLILEFNSFIKKFYHFMSYYDEQNLHHYQIKTIRQNTVKVEKSIIRAEERKCTILVVYRVNDYNLDRSSGH